MGTMDNCHEVILEGSHLAHVLSTGILVLVPSRGDFESLLAGLIIATNCLKVVI